MLRIKEITVQAGNVLQRKMSIVAPIAQQVNFKKKLKLTRTLSFPVLLFPAEKYASFT
jgi:hypothetical protein